MSRLAPQLRVISGSSESEGADLELVRAFLAGDSMALSALVRRHQEAVFRVSRRFAASADDARDLSQRAFLNALEAAPAALSRLVRDSVSFRAWLLRIALNVGLNHVRDARVRSQHLSPVAGQVGPTPVELLERAQEQALTRRAVLELPDRQREVFLLRIDAALSFAEVASALDITEANAKSHFHHAVQRLKAEVAKLSAGES